MECTAADLCQKTTLKGSEKKKFTWSLLGTKALRTCGRVGSIWKEGSTTELVGRQGVSFARGGRVCFSSPYDARILDVASE